METLVLYGPLMARILIVFMFLYSGIGKITGFKGTQIYMASAGIPATAFFLVVAILTDLLGGLSVLFGYYAQIGATALFIYTLIATAIFHRNISDHMQMIMFSKNIAIMGGLLFIIIYGAGPMSLN